MHLVPAVENGGFRIAAHTCGAHLVDGHTRIRTVVVGPDVFKTRCFQHFGGIVHHVLTHFHVLLLELRVELQYGLSPGVFHRGIERNDIIFIRQTFAEATQAHGPVAWFCQHILEIFTYTHLSNTACPAATAGATLVAEAANVITLVGTDVAVTRYIDTVGAAAKEIFIVKAFHGAGSAVTEVVIHQVFAQYPAIVAQTIRETFGDRVQQYEGGAQGRAIHKDDLCVILCHLFGVLVYHFYTGGLAFCFIVNNGIHDRIGS